MLVCAFFQSIKCTRDRGCSAHPVFPAPSHEGRVRPLFGGRDRICKPRAKACRENEKVCLTVIARSEATKQSSLREASLDCFASLAMTFVVVPASEPGPIQRRWLYQAHRQQREVLWVPAQGRDDG